MLPPTVPSLRPSEVSRAPPANPSYGTRSPQYSMVPSRGDSSNRAVGTLAVFPGAVRFWVRSSGRQRPWIEANVFPGNRFGSNHLASFVVISVRIPVIVISTDRSSDLSPSGRRPGRARPLRSADRARGPESLTELSKSSRAPLHSKFTRSSDSQYFGGKGNQGGYGRSWKLLVGNRSPTMIVDRKTPHTWSHDRKRSFDRASRLNLRRRKSVRMSGDLVRSEGGKR